MATTAPHQCKESVFRDQLIIRGEIRDEHIRNLTCLVCVNEMEQIFNQQIQQLEKQIAEHKNKETIDPVVCRKRRIQSDDGNNRRKHPKLEVMGPPTSIRETVTIKKHDQKFNPFISQHEKPHSNGEFHRRYQQSDDGNNRRKHPKLDGMVPPTSIRGTVTIKEHDQKFNPFIFQHDKTHRNGEDHRRYQQSGDGNNRRKHPKLGGMGPPTSIRGTVTIKKHDQKSNPFISQHDKPHSNGEDHQRYQQSDYGNNRRKHPKLEVMGPPTSICGTVTIKKHDQKSNPFIFQHHKIHSDGGDHRQYHHTVAETYGEHRRRLDKQQTLSKHKHHKRY
ncbi:unnamed protein product [Hermetia illucens]|uniref:Uncharacterized protein n=1 Tax=Hermetia illucens TaxID=343691 RepID=A0A7R8YW99_HERIL|nr:unnamed protein product [Hermetia illucens]